MASETQERARGLFVALEAEPFNADVTPPAEGCPLLPLTPFFEANATCNINGAEIEFAGQGVGPDIICATLTPVTFELNGLNTWFETTITAASECSTMGTCLNLASKDPLDSVVVAVNPGGVARAELCSDIGGPPTPVPGFTNTSLTLPYTIQMRLNGATGEISYIDTGGNSGSIGIYPSLNSSPLQLTPVGVVFGGACPGYTGLESGTFNLNAGYTDPVIPVPAGFETYCVVSPPAVACGPSVLSEIVSPEPQTVVISGQSVETTSLGNANYQGGIVSDKSWQTGTKNVHTEITLDKVATASGAFGLIYADDFSGSPNIMAGVVYSFEFGGILIDAFGGVPVAFSPPGIGPGYTLALYIDGSGTASIFDGISIGNVLAVNPLFTPATILYMGGPLDAGDVLGEELDVTYNFDGPTFAISPQADKYCDPNP